MELWQLQLEVELVLTDEFPELVDELQASRVEEDARYEHHPEVLVRELLDLSGDRCARRGEPRTAGRGLSRPVWTGVGWTRRSTPRRASAASLTG